MAGRKLPSRPYSRGSLVWSSSSKPYLKNHKENSPSLTNNWQFRSECRAYTQSENKGNLPMELWFYGVFILTPTHSWHWRKLCPWKCQCLLSAINCFAAKIRGIRLERGLADVMNGSCPKEKKEINFYFPNPSPHRLKQDSPGSQKYAEIGLRRPSGPMCSCPGPCHQRRTWPIIPLIRSSRCLQLAGIFTLLVLWECCLLCKTFVLFRKLIILV